MVEGMAGAQASASPVLRVSGLRRDFGDLTAIEGFDLDLAAGECVSLIGHNGSGKTTALRAAAGQLEPTSGTVTVRGANVHDRRHGHVAQARLAFVPDTPVLYDDLTVGEHLELVGLAHGVSDELDEHIAVLWGDLNPTPYSGTRPSTSFRSCRLVSYCAVPCRHVRNGGSFVPSCAAPSAQCRLVRLQSVAEADQAGEDGAGPSVWQASTRVTVPSAASVAVPRRSTPRGSAEDGYSQAVADKAGEQHPEQRAGWRGNEPEHGSGQRRRVGELAVIDQRCHGQSGEEWSGDRVQHRPHSRGGSGKNTSASARLP